MTREATRATTTILEDPIGARFRSTSLALGTSSVVLLPNAHTVSFVFRATVIDGIPTVTDDQESDRFKWVGPRDTHDLLSYWGMDSALHDEYGALNYTGQWEDRD